MTQIYKPKEFLKEYGNIEGLRLVNGLFIVKYIDAETCEIFGEFDKTNYEVRVFNSSGIFAQKFKPSQKLKMTTLGYWKKLNIGWKEKPISEVVDSAKEFFKGFLKKTGNSGYYINERGEMEKIENERG